MFLDRHDFGVVFVVCVASGLVALAMAIPLARSVTADSRALRNAMRALGEEDAEYEYEFASSSRGAGRHAAPGSVPDAPPPASLATAELDDLSRELTTTAARLAESRERERALERSRRELVAWSRTTCARRWPACARWPRLWRTASPPIRCATTPRSATSVDRLSGMVDDLFEMSRIHAGALRLTLQRVPLTDLVDEAVIGADPLARACGVALQADVRTAAGRARRCQGAVTGADQPGRQRDPAYPERRRGPGGGDGARRPRRTRGSSTPAAAFPTRTSNRVFEVAWRGTAARTPEPLAGAGLGLAIVRGIVEAHSGEVDVRNVVGGCRFEVRLPVPVGCMPDAG